MKRIIPKHNVHLQLWLCGKCSELVFVWIEVTTKSFGKKTICIKMKKKKGSGYFRDHFVKSVISSCVKSLHHLYDCIDSGYNQDYSSSEFRFFTIVITK